MQAPPPPDRTSSSLLQSSSSCEVEPSIVMEPQPEPLALIYDETLNHDNDSDQPSPWWKRYQLLLALGFGLIIGASAVSIVFVVVNKGNNGPNKNFNSNATDIPPQQMSDSYAEPTTPGHCVLSAQTVKRLFEVDCDQCYPSVGVEGEWVVASRSFRDVQFFSHVDGKFETVTVIDIDFFVSDIAISGDVAILGAAGENNNTGAAYVYERNPSGWWTLFTRIVPNDIRLSAMFGNLVDIDGDVILVGATDDRDGWIGSAYVYRRTETTWVQEAKLAPHDSILQNFGSSVSVKGNLVAVGDYWYGEGNEGAVFVYEYDSSSSSWVHMDHALHNINCDGGFGSSLAWTHDDGLIIGCHAENSGTGAVYYYQSIDSDTGFHFALNQKIIASDGTYDFNFGFLNGIAVDESIMIVGTCKGANGKAYVFTQMDNFWIEVAKIEAPTGDPFFGCSVTLSSQNAFISSTNNVYYYKLEKCQENFPHF